MFRLTIQDGVYLTLMEERHADVIFDAVEQTRGNYVEAAGILGVHPNYLHRLIRNLDMKDVLKDVLREGWRSPSRGLRKISGGGTA